MAETDSRQLTETVKKLQEEVENLRLELKRAKSVPSGKIGLVFAVPGIISLVIAFFKDSNVLAFIGLGLTFWGALFFFVRPIRYVHSNLVGSTALPIYKTVDRIILDLKFKGKSCYIPPYPEEIYLPDYLKGLKDMVVFIPADTGGTPSIEELAKGKFLLKNPNGLCIPPPGLGLLKHFEKELGRDLAKFELAELCEVLPSVIVDGLQLAKEMEMKIEADNQVYLKMLDSAYRDLYSLEENLRSVHMLGCPVASAIACVLAKASGKVVIISKDKVSSDGQTIEVWYRFGEG